MPVTGNVYVDDLPGHVRVRIEGGDPTHPWTMVLTPQAAFNLGLELRMKAEDAGFKGNAIPVNATGGGQPQRRPPALQASRDGQGGPTSNVDGGRLAAMPVGGSGPTPAPANAVDDLLGEDEF